MSVEAVEFGNNVPSRNRLQTFGAGCVALARRIFASSDDNRLTYVVNTGGWPPRGPNDLTADEVMAVLDEFDPYYDAALDSLANTRIPGPHEFVR